MAEGTTWAPPARHDIATFDTLNTWYYSDAPKSVAPTLDVVRRQSTFDEIYGSFDEATAGFEARRCLSCGNCLECDNCSYGGRIAIDGDPKDHSTRDLLAKLSQ